MKNHTAQFVPCTPMACFNLIVREFGNNEAALVNKKVCILGRSNIVGMPLFLLLNKKNMIVSMCHSYMDESDRKDMVSKADVVVSCAGVTGLIKADWVKEGAIVIDVGIN